MGSTTRTITTPNTRRLAAGLTLAVSLALAACGGGGDDDAADSGDMEAAAAGDTGDATVGDSSGAADDGFVRSGEGAPAQGDFDLGVVGRDVIIEMRVVLSSDDIERTVSAVMADAAALGGGVASSDVNYGTANGGEEGYAILTVKVPPQSLDRLLAGLDDTATVQSINQSAQDVTEQLVDLDVRIRNARQSVANVREFMDRTENLNELVTLEGELTRRQTELERLEAQQRNLQDRVALSTVTIEIVRTTAVPAPEADEGIGDAFAKGWDAFVTFFFGLAFVLAVVAPFLALGALAVGLVWLLTERLGRDRAHPLRTSVGDEAVGERLGTVSTEAGDATGDEVSDELVTASHED